MTVVYGAAVEWAARFPDGHREALHAAPGHNPTVPAWMANAGVVIVQRQVRTRTEHGIDYVEHGPWFETTPPVPVVVQ